jgi:ribosomal protein L30/L7E
MGRRAPVLVAPDPILLAELIPEWLFEKIVDAGVILISDADGTVVDSVPFYCRWLSRKLKQRIDPSEITRYDFKDVHPDALGMLQESVFTSARMHRDLPLTEGAKEALTRLSEAGVPIIILTARPVRNSSLVRATANHLRKGGVPFDLLIFSRRKREIVKALKRLDRRVHAVVVDDDPNVARDIAHLKNVTAIIYTATYNLRLKREGVVRAGETPGDPHKWSVVVEEVLKRLNLPSQR